MMEKIVSYKAAIKHLPMFSHRALKDTVVIYREAVSFIAKVVDKEWQAVSIIDTLKNKEHYVESLIHKTKQNKSPAYGVFDKLFYKFPSYLRRSATDEAIGLVSSYRSNLENYEKERYLAISNGQKFQKRRPKLQTMTSKFPCLFRKNMYNRIDRNEIEIKVLKGKDWVWIPIKVREQDLKYIEKNMTNLKELAPSLVYEDRKYKLSFPFKKIVSLPKEKRLQQRRILSVDLGINTQATCCVMDGEGTILDRRFIKLSKEIDRMHRLLNRLKGIQEASGRSKQKKIWNKINGYKKELTNKTVHYILAYALEQNVDVIVLENLSPKMGRANRTNRAKIHHWNKRTIIKKVCQKAHFYGIRYSLVNPRNTSKLAFDGSGVVKRDEKNYSIAYFANGKTYNADLSASYNIGARYFIRAYSKSTLATRWSDLQAQVPELQRRTLCTLATFRSLLKASRTTVAA